MPENIKKEIAVVVVAGIAIIVFLVGSGYITLAFPFSFALQPTVRLAIDRQHPVKNFGGNFFDAISILRITPNQLSGRPVFLDHLTAEIDLKPISSQKENGFSFYLISRSCLKVFPYGYGYGYPSTICVSNTAFPVEAMQNVNGTRVVFGTQDSPLRWAFDEGKVPGELQLMAHVPYTGITNGNRFQRVQVRIENPLFRTAEGVRVRVQPSNIIGSWLTIHPGYGYPTTKK